MNTVITRKNVLNNWNQCKCNESPKTDICIYLHEKTDIFCCMNINEIHHQMRIWKQEIISGNLFVFKENCKTKTINRVMYHLLVIQGPGTTVMSKAGMLFDDCFFCVGGWIYLFKHEKNRDDVFNWLNKYNQTVLPKDKDLCCHICMNEEEQSLLTSCCRHNICATCVKKKSKSECPYCRKEFK